MELLSSITLGYTPVTHWIALVNMMVADVLAPNRRQSINNNDAVFFSVTTKYDNLDNSYNAKYKVTTVEKALL